MEKSGVVSAINRAGKYLVCSVICDKRQKHFKSFKCLNEHAIYNLLEFKRHNKKEETRRRNGIQVMKSKFMFDLPSHCSYCCFETVWAVCFVHDSFTQIRISSILEGNFAFNFSLSFPFIPSWHTKSGGKKNQDEQKKNQHWKALIRRTTVKKTDPFD